MRPDAESYLTDLLDVLQTWRSHEHESAMWLARAEGAVTAYRAIGVMTADQARDWLDRYRAAASSSPS